jgi:hypothetical protein
VLTALTKSSRHRHPNNSLCFNSLPGWRPFHSNLLVLFSKTSFPLKCLLKARVTLRLVVYCQSVNLGAKPLETHDQILFQPNSFGHSPYLCVLFGLLASPAQSSSGPSTPELISTYYCLRFETTPSWRATSPYLYSPE